MDLHGIGAGSIVRRKENGAYECVSDDVAVEEPLEIRLGDQSLAVTMRTPGHDEELAAGFLLSEGILTARAELRDLKNVEPNVVQALAPSVKFQTGNVQRFGTISSSCGLCGKTSIESTRQKFPPIEFAATSRFKGSELLNLPDRLRAAQGNFSRTGGIHAAGIFNFNGKLLVLREDVGRHNAVDKVIGRAFLDDFFPLKNHVLVVSGRSSFEIVQKALAARIPIIAAVSAPSSLAINFARENGQTLVGFLRPPTFNVYSHVEQIDFDA